MKAERGRDGRGFSFERVLGPIKLASSLFLSGTKSDRGSLMHLGFVYIKCLILEKSRELI